MLANKLKMIKYVITKTKFIKNTCLKIYHPEEKPHN